MKYTAQELFELLNDQDECPWIEAKGGSESSHSVMETVCAYCNEPGLGGGYIVMGVAEDHVSQNMLYKVIGVNDTDKFQRDFATQCNSMFNLPVRPELWIEKLNGKSVIVIWINEVPQRQKPVYFKSDGLPHGALRRIGSTDQHCTDDDMHIFYRDSSSFDQAPVKGLNFSHIDGNALKRYRTLREKVNPIAEELSYTDSELLQALGCVNRENPAELNMAGLLLFGSSAAQRSTYPMLRVDYIRIPGNQWIENPDDRFTSIDMRGSLILLLYRLIDAINSDLPKGFLLADDSLQATSVGLPMKVLREAIVNALMHRSYREHRPTQVIRYDNRIEITNPGFSLKSEEKLGLPGSETRNPFIAAVFHDTNLAETKGSGIRAMRRLMQQARLVMPTFESSRENNEFTVRLLLHHFLNEEDLNWLNRFSDLQLTDANKQALIFVREVGAIDNKTYRQMADCDTLKASSDLRNLKNLNLLKPKGKGKATYYVPDAALNTQATLLNTQATPLNTQASVLSTEPMYNANYEFDKANNELNTERNNALNTQATTLSTQPPFLNTQPLLKNRDELLNILPVNVQNKISNLKKRESNPNIVKDLILEMCSLHSFKSVEIAIILQRREDYTRHTFLNGMIQSKELKYLYPEMISHPEQAYITNKVQ